MAAPTSAARTWPAYGALACGLALLLDLPERLILPALWSWVPAWAQGSDEAILLASLVGSLLTSLFALPPLLAALRLLHSPPRLRLLLEAMALAGLFLITPDLVANASRLGYREGAALAERDRRAEGHPPRPPRPTPRLPEGAQRGLTAFSVTGLAFLLLRRLRKQEARAHALQDQALRAKLAPHFIFNTLNTLKAQIAADPEGAESTTDRLASLFRQVVQVADQPTIPLRQELAFVEAYLGIEQARLGDRLRVVLDIPEDLEDHPVPPLAVQVLVENAIKHGIAPFEQPGTVTIQAEGVPEGMRLSVRDTGLGSAIQNGTGTALATLRQRLAKPEDLRWERLPSGFQASFTWRQP